MKHIFIIILIICLLPALCFAVTREAAIQYALEKSEDIKIAYQKSENMKAGARELAAFTKPQINMIGSHMEMGDNAEENPFFETPERNISASIEASQLLYAGGRIWNSLDLEKNLYNQADLIYAFEKRDIIKNVKSAFDSVLLEQALLDILKDRLMQRRNELEDAKDLRDVGMVTSLDVRQAQLNLNVTNDELKSAQASYESALINFNLAAGRQANTDLWIPEGKLDNIPDINEILEKLMQALSGENLLDINSLKTKVEASHLNYKITQGAKLPELALVSSLKSSGEKWDNTDESWNIGLQLNWNVFDGGSIRAKTASARSELNIAKENLNKTRKGIAGTVEKISIHIKSLEERILLQKQAVKLSRENYEDARGQYRAGTITLTSLGEFNLVYAETRFILQRLYFAQRDVLTQAEALLGD
ncbi:Outer membrane efflux protein [Desulfonema limicola]|uniref:Outer membrane efflux protein n=1 Tax=Desulfonema limicola TaxID=45656 RepID=A0A975B5G1_9BACT|nr:TolC family protein [Desulfonema limicola]QTA79135.1 Outer membrane efflux protein [Desulfonema limicola]